MPEHPDFSLDDAISAELDGELAPFAAELGIDVPTLRAQMTDQPGYADRLAALDAARQALRAPVPPLDDVTRARLLRAIPDEADQPRARANSAVPLGRDRVLRILAAAAAVVVLVGGGVALVGRGGSSSDQQSKAATGAGARVRSGQLGDLGSLDSNKLDALIGGGTDETARSGGDPSGTASVPPERSPEVSGDSQRAFGSSQPKAAADASVTLAQVDACRAEYAKIGTVRFSGTGDYQGRPAVVLGLETGGRTIVFVVGATDCSEVLVSVSR